MEDAPRLTDLIGACSGLWGEYLMLTLHSAPGAHGKGLRIGTWLLQWSRARLLLDGKPGWSVMFIWDR